MNSKKNKDLDEPKDELDDAYDSDSSTDSHVVCEWN